MRTIVEMFDPQDPIYNVLIPSAMQPDQIIFFTCQDISAQLAAFGKYFEHVLPRPVVMRQIVCDIRDVASSVRLMNALIDEHADPQECTIDVTGGNEALLMAVGIVCADRPLDVVLYQHDTKEILHLWGKPAQYSVPIVYHTDVNARILLSGGDCVGVNHAFADQLPAAFLNKLPDIFRIYFNHRREWSHFVIVLQHLQREFREGRLWLRGPICYTEPRGTHHMLSFNILRDLSNLNIVDDLFIKGGEFSCSVQSEEMVRLLCDTGSWLELFIWYTMCNTPAFDDVRRNINLVWRRDVDSMLNTANEVDVLATIGPTMFLISCKSGTPQTTALNEIATLTRKFGGAYAIPVLATACELNTDAPAIMRRARDMQVEIIDANDLQSEEALRARLLQIAQQWQDYQEELQW